MANTFDGHKHKHKDLKYDRNLWNHELESILFLIKLYHLQKFEFEFEVQICLQNE